MSVKSFLESKGFQIITAPDELSNMSTQGPVHVLVFDTETFFSHGTGIFDLCKRRNNLPDFPIVFVSDNYELNPPRQSHTAIEPVQMPFRLYEIEQILSAFPGNQQKGDHPKM